jgi:hypothetical protein
VSSALYRTVGLVTAATVVLTLAAAGCSKNGTVGPGPGNPSSPSSSTAPSATASARFVGQWHVHDASLNISPTTATLIASLGAGACTDNAQAPCSETDQLAVVSGNDTQLTLSVTGVSYTLHGGQNTSANPTTGPSTAVGDSIQLVWRAPGLLERTALKGFPGWQGGNPYWCGAGISQSDAEKCGA